MPPVDQRYIVLPVPENTTEQEFADAIDGLCVVNGWKRKKERTALDAQG
jgi:hypothetical protein